MKDHLVKATAEGVRIYGAVTTDLVNEAIRRHDCYPVAAAALGRTMTGALLMAANLKNQEALTIKFSGGGPFGRCHSRGLCAGLCGGASCEPALEQPGQD